jgi:hypothetical protein
VEAQQQVVVFGDSLSNNADVGLATNLQLRTPSTYVPRYCSADIYTPPRRRSTILDTINVYKCARRIELWPRFRPRPYYWQ